MKSIKAFGLNTPLGVCRNIVIMGNGRYEALQRLGYKKVPIVRLDHLSEQEAKAYALADNRIQEESFFDNDLLKSALEDLQNFNFDLDVIGFDMDEIDNLFDEETEIDYEKANETPKVEKTTFIKDGDLIELGEHRLLCGDSTLKESYEKVLQREKIDMIFTDPPYGVSYNDKNEFLNQYDKGNKIQKPIKNDSLSIKELKEFLLKVFKNLKNNLSEYNSYYITAPQGGDLLIAMMMMTEAGLTLRHMLIWNKNNHVLGRVDYMYKHEPILYGWTTKHKFYGKGKYTKSVWDIPKPLKSDLHPTMKPVELVENTILNSTEKGMVVFDSFMGSGTTIIACENTKRKARGIELDPHYCQVIVERWCNYTEQDKIKINGKKLSLKELKG